MLHESCRPLPNKANGIPKRKIPTILICEPLSQIVLFHASRFHPKQTDELLMVISENKKRTSAARDATQWEEDWDDADVRDDFSKQLRAELDAREGK